MAVSGSCLCGGIQFECSEDIAFSYLCHCTDCQRSSGAPYAACAMLRAEAVTITRGEPRAFRHPGGSGAMIEKRFCGDCGAQMFSNSVSQPDMLVVRIGVLDDPGAAVPALHIWTHSALPWALPDDGAARLPRGPRDGDDPA